MAAELPFRTLGPWLRERFGRPVHRVALDAGSSCPNRDGTRAFGGCTYCDVEGSGTGALRGGVEIALQLERGLARIARRGAGAASPGPGAIAYLQSYSNTYVAPERLEEVLAPIEARLGAADAPAPIVAVSLATRPDTLPEWALARLRALAERVEVWVELGLEAADDGVLEEVRRFHTVEEWRAAARRVRAAGLGLVGHAILGLPGDGRAGARRTAEALAEARCDGVKVHHLMVLRRTQLERRWRDGALEVLDAATYVAWLADFVERLGPEQVLHRLTGDAPPEALLAPRWDVHKNAVRDGLAAELRARGTRQGARAPQTRPPPSFSSPR